MRVVSNAGPLIHLARAGHFNLLQVLFGRVIIPSAVYQYQLWGQAFIICLLWERAVGSHALDLSRVKTQEGVAV